MKYLIVTLFFGLTLACIRCHKADEQGISIAKEYHQQLVNLGIPQKEVDAFQESFDRLKRPCRLEVIAHIKWVEAQLETQKVKAEAQKPGDQEVTVRYFKALSFSYTTERVLEGK